MANKKVNIAFPEWMNSKFFEKILKKSEKDGSIQVGFSKYIYSKVDIKLLS